MMKTLVALLLGNILAVADVVKFQGEFYSFEIELGGKVSLPGTEGNIQKVEKLYENFIGYKDDFEKLIDLYAPEAASEILDSAVTEEGKKNFMNSVKGMNSIRVRALIVQKSKNIVLIHVNENSSYPLIFPAEVTFDESGEALLLQAEQQLDRSDSPLFWIMQIWNAFPNTNPSIVAK